MHFPFYVPLVFKVTAVLVKDLPVLCIFKFLKRNASKVMDKYILQQKILISRSLSRYRIIVILKHPDPVMLI